MMWISDVNERVVTMARWGGDVGEINNRDRENVYCKSRDIILAEVQWTGVALWTTYVNIGPMDRMDPVDWMDPDFIYPFTGLLFDHSNADSTFDWPRVILHLVERLELRPRVKRKGLRGISTLLRKVN
jgi:hypothetical protein